MKTPPLILELLNTTCKHLCTSSLLKRGGQDPSNRIREKWKSMNDTGNDFSAPPSSSASRYRHLLAPFLQSSNLQVCTALQWVWEFMCACVCVCVCVCTVSVGRHLWICLHWSEPREEPRWIPPQGWWTEIKTVAKWKVRIVPEQSIKQLRSSLCLSVFAFRADYTHLPASQSLPHTHTHTYRRVHRLTTGVWIRRQSAGWSQRSINRWNIYLKALEDLL